MSGQCKRCGHDGGVCDGINQFHADLPEEQYEQGFIMKDTPTPREKFELWISAMPYERDALLELNNVTKQRDKLAEALQKIASGVYAWHTCVDELAPEALQSLSQNAIGMAAGADGPPMPGN